MTSNPHRAATRRLAVLAALLTLVAACGQASPSASPAPAPSTAAPSTPAPTASPSAPPSLAPTSSAAARVSCTDTVESPAPSAAPQEQASPDANDPNAATYSEIESQVTAIRGLTLNSPVQRATFDRAALGKFVEASFNRDNPAALVDGNERLLKGLALMPQDASLRDLYVEMLTSQVAGLYDDTTKKMYVVTETGEIGPAEEITYAHEYTHALQDQAFNLGAIKGKATDQSDRALARTTLIEGDATLLMSIWAQQHLTQAQLLQVAGATDPASQAVLGSPARDPARDAPVPVHAGAQPVARRLHVGAAATRASTPCSPTRPTRPSRSSTPRSSTRARRRCRCRSPTTSRSGSATAGACRSRTRWASSSCGSCSATRPAWTAPTAQAAAAGWGGDRVALIDGPDGATRRGPRHPLGHGRRRGRVRGGPRGHRRRSCRRSAAAPRS